MIRDMRMLFICMTVANVLWFGAFFIGIWFFGWPWFTMLVPIAFHWNKRDYGVLECDHES